MRRWRAAVLIGVSMLASRASAGPVTSTDAVAERAAHDASALHGLAGLDGGYALVRWPRFVAPATSGGHDNRGGLWLRVGHDGEHDIDVPRDGWHVAPDSAPLTAPFPYFSLAGGEDFFGQLWMRLGSGVGVRVEYHVVELGDPRGPWCGAAPSAAGRIFGTDGITGHHEVAQVVGVGFTLAVSDHLDIGTQYGHAFGAGLADPALAGAGAHFGYLELNLRY